MPKKLIKIKNRPLEKRKIFTSQKTNYVTFTRPKENPIITPIKDNSWEAKSTFNPGAIYLNGKVHIFYRAMSQDNTSVIGYATTKDGIHIDYRHPEPIYVPRKPFEQKLQKEANSGCEDPRLVKIGNKIYMFYTAVDGKHPPRVALTSINVKDFLNKKWKWDYPVLISPPDINDKDATMFPEKIKGKYIIIHRIGKDIDISFHKDLNFDGNQWLEKYSWLTPRKGWWDSKKVGIAGTPIKTQKGWLLLYHGVSYDEIYRVGAVLTDLKDPIKIIGRTDYPIFEPETDYEKVGETPNVVFPCGVVLINNTLFMYYGGADKVVGVATIKLTKLLKVFKKVDMENKKNKAKKVAVKKVIIFDLDGTLTESKTPLDKEMSEILCQILKNKIIAAIGGGSHKHFKKQFLNHLKCQKERLKNLFILPTSGSKLYKYNRGKWKLVYKKDLNKKEKETILDAIKKAFDDIKYIPPKKTYGKTIEDRGSQITFSVLGQKAPLEEKEKWNKKYNNMRKKLKSALEKYLPNFEVRLGGLTSVDITKREIDKAYGIQQISKILHIPIKDMIYIGDALYEGGNDFAVIKTGIDTIRVKGPEDVKYLLYELLKKSK